jgi:hypothetical protein
VRPSSLQSAVEEYLQPLEEAFLRKVGREGAKEPYLTMVGIGAKSTSRSALLEHWGEQGIYPFRSQMAKVEQKMNSRKFGLGLWPAAQTQNFATQSTG